MDIIKEYQFVIYGCLAGALLAILIFIVGFFKMIIIILLSFLGAVIGYCLNKIYIYKLERDL